MDGFAAWPGNLEIRQEGGGVRLLVGTFPYGTLATLDDRGEVRKETFLPLALGYAIGNTQHRIDILVGHDFGKPIASRQSGTLQIRDTPAAVEFEATLPSASLTPSWVTDAERAILNGTMVGLSPGFRIPPRSAVPDAESLVPEPGNPSVKIRQIRQAMLREFSVVTSGSYRDAGVELRSDEWPDCNTLLLIPTAATLWL